MLDKLIRLFSPQQTPAVLEQIFISPRAGEPMLAVEQCRTVENRGLVGDRYYSNTGYWHKVESCQVTLITKDDFKQIRKRSQIDLQAGQHRRNLVISGMKTKQLQGLQFQIGTAIFEYEKPKPPCGYINQITQKGMAKALGRNSGICLKVIQSGMMRIGNKVILVH